MNADRPDLVSNEIEPSFWAEQQNKDANQRMESPPLNDDFDDDYAYDNEAPLPDLGQAVDSGIAMGDSLVATFKPTHALSLNYARTAKKIDVQELKRVLWQEIQPKTRSRTEHSTSFSSLVQGLDKTDLPKEMLKDVSVPYCFICLLHLANEHNLDIGNNGDDLLVLSRSQ